MMISVLVRDSVDLCDCREVLLDEDFLDDIVVVVGCRRDDDEAKTIAR